MQLDEIDEGRLAGQQGPALRLAAELVVKAARIMGAGRLIPATFSHIDSCFYAGQAHVDFAQYLAEHGARFAVPTWTNTGVASLDDAGVRPEAAGARRLMELYLKLGAAPTFTCAPYQLKGRPGFGDHIVASESNTVPFYNGVIGARSNKYGDYLDVACALLGKVPDAGLHRDAARHGDILFSLADLPERLKRENMMFHLAGIHIGAIAGRRVPVVSGIGRASEDDLKALSAAMAASGGVEHFHMVGVTPEAPDLAAAFGGGEPREAQAVTGADLRRARDALTGAEDGPVDMVALGTPHFSFTEFAALAPLLDGRRIGSRTMLIVTTSRAVRQLATERGWIAALERAGARIIVDTCSYFSPALRGCRGTVMTNAAKWAYYAPGMLGVRTVFGSLSECAETAVRGTVWRDPELWRELEA